MSPHYPIPAAPVEVATEVKKSRFIARAAHCSSRAAAQSLLGRARSDYPDARHHCWAYRLGDPACPHSAAMADDGEPSGTAGKPILNILSHQPIGDLMLIVIRYFGGIRLGAGGLARAYAQAAKLALDALPIKPYTPQLETVVRCEFSQEPLLRHWLASHQGQILAASYDRQVQLHLRLPQCAAVDWDAFCAQLQLVDITGPGSDR